MDLGVIMGLVGAVVGLIVALCSVIAKYSKNKKVKANAEATIDILSELFGYIEAAEKLNVSGENKKAVVTARIMNYANANGISVDMEDVEGVIDRLVEFSKHVNANAKEPAETVFLSKKVETGEQPATYPKTEV